MVHLTDRSQRVGFDKKNLCDFSCVFLDGVMINHVESGARYQQKIMTFSCVSLMFMIYHVESGAIYQPCLLKQPPLLRKPLPQRRLSAASPSACRAASEGPFPANACQVREPRDERLNHWTCWT